MNPETIYLFYLIGAIRWLFVILSFVSGILGVVIAFSYDDVIDKVKKIILSLAIFCIICVFLSILIPTSDTLMLMFGIY